MIILYLTCANITEARLITDVLIEGKLVACVRRMSINSTYWWHGEINNDNEILLMMESIEDKYDAINAKVAALHSYDVYVLTALPVIKTTPGVEKWLREVIE